MKPYPTPPEGLQVVSAPPLLTLTLDRPQRRNSLTDDIVLALIDTLEAASADEEIRAALLNAEGDNFCSGFDLAGRAGGRSRPRPGSISRRMPYLVNRLIPVMLEVQVPIVCAVRGWAVGLGLSLALASDFAVVADDARLRAPFTSMGITPDSGSSWLLPRLAGVARAKQMLMLGEEVSGADAADWGLIHQSVPRCPCRIRGRRAGRQIGRFGHRGRRSGQNPHPPQLRAQPGGPPGRRGLRHGVVVPFRRLPGVGRVPPRGPSPRLHRPVAISQTGYNGTGR